MVVTTQKWSKDYQNTVNLNTQEYKENTDKSICFGQGHKIGQEIMEKQQIEKKLFFFFFPCSTFFLLQKE